MLQSCPANLDRVGDRRRRWPTCGPTPAASAKAAGGARRGNPLGSATRSRLHGLGQKTVSGRRRAQVAARRSIGEGQDRVDHAGIAAGASPCGRRSKGGGRCRVRTCDPQLVDRFRTGADPCRTVSYGSASADYQASGRDWSRQVRVPPSHLCPVRTIGPPHGSSALGVVPENSRSHFDQQPECRLCRYRQRLTDLFTEQLK